MSKFESVTKPLMWFMALSLVALAAGCGGGGQSQILGGGGGGGGTISGAVCTVVSGATIPTVTSSNPTSGNTKATISTIGQGGSKLITATFSLPMRSTTLTSTTFTLAPVGQSVLTGTVVSYDALSQLATLKTAAALLPNTSYTATITQGAVTSAGGVPLSCVFTWNFTTVAPPPALGGPVNLGMASSFGIASRAGITTNAATSPIINGNVALINTLTCNTAAVPGGVGLAGLGTCNAVNPPTLNGTVYIPTNPDATTANAVFVDLNTAYNSITAAQLPLATVLNGSVIGSGAGACAGVLPGCSGNATLPPGVYTGAPSIGIDGTLTLDAGGNTDAVWVFQMPSSTLTTSTGAVINLIGGAKASNVWWQVGSSATIGTNSVFNGNVLAYIDLTFMGGATSCGRLLSGANPTVGSGAIVLSGGSTASVPGNVNAPAGCL